MLRKRPSRPFRGSASLGVMMEAQPRTRKPASVKVCALLHKPARARVTVPIDYLGFTIEDRFVVGYGLDWAETYRNPPYIGVVERT